MKFSELTAEQWKEWGPYLDTCILPVSGLTGLESPVEVAEQLGRLRDWLDGVEIPFHGRTVTYPACHFTGGREPQPADIELLEKVCGRLRQQGFTYIIIVSQAVRLRQGEVPQADTIFTPAELRTEDVNAVKKLMKDEIQKMWHASRFEE